jgi:hypothetical protein
MMAKPEQGRTRHVEKLPQQSPNDAQALRTKAWLRIHWTNSCLRIKMAPINNFPHAASVRRFSYNPSQYQILSVSNSPPAYRETVNPDARFVSDALGHETRARCFRSSRERWLTNLPWNETKYHRFGADGQVIHS